jgi:hypothetical protein
VIRTRGRISHFELTVQVQTSEFSTCLVCVGLFSLSHEKHTVVLNTCSTHLNEFGSIQFVRLAADKLNRPGGLIQLSTGTRYYTYLVLCFSWDKLKRPTHTRHLYQNSVEIRRNQDSF